MAGLFKRAEEECGSLSPHKRLGRPEQQEMSIQLSEVQSTGQKMGLH